MQTIELVLVLGASFVFLLAVVFRRRFGATELTLSSWTVLLIRTNFLNRVFWQVGRQHKRPLQAFMNLAPPVAATLCVAALCMLLREGWAALLFCSQLLERLFLSSDTASLAAYSAVGGAAYASGPAHLALAVPGLTIPWAHAGYLWLAAFVSLCVHESGHALAAAAEGVALHHVAFFLAVWVPGAYVVLDSEALSQLTPWRVLRVVCAGVWFNGLLCMACWVLALLLPTLLLPAFATGQGAVIWSVPLQSPLREYLHPGDAITNVNGCKVGSADTFRECIYNQDAAQQPLAPVGKPALNDSSMSPSAAPVSLDEPLLAGSQCGYCVPQTSINQAQACLLDMRQQHGTSCGDNELCFADVQHDFNAASLQGAMELLTADADVERHILRARTGGSSQVSGVCLRARQVAAQPSCISDADTCPAGTKCLAPLLHYGAHMFRMEFQPRRPHAAAVQRPSLRRMHRRLLDGLTAQQRRHRRRLDIQAGHSAAKARQSASQRGVLGSSSKRQSESTWAADLQGQLQPWVVEAHNMIARAAEAATDAKASKAAAEAEAEAPFVVWVATSAESLSAFEMSMRLRTAVELSNLVPSPYASFLVQTQCESFIFQLLGYTFAVSAALGLLNMIPATFLDGGAALSAALDMKAWQVSAGWALAGCDPARRASIRVVVMRICTALFTFVLGVHILRLF